MPLELHNQKSRVVIFPELGGMVNHFFVKHNGKETDVIFGYSSLEEAKKEIGNDFRSSTLSPYPNRIREGKYSFKGKTYQLDQNFPQEENSIHGLLYDQSFVILSQSDTKAVLEKVVDKNDFKGYPFSYRIVLHYSLNEATLNCKTEIENLSPEAIPMAYGIHPYFALGDPVDTLEMKLPDVKNLSVDKHMIPTETEEEFKNFSGFKTLKSVDLDDGFRITEKGETVETVIRNSELALIVSQEIGTNKFNFLQVYTPAHRNAVAIEPMSSSANSFNSGNGLTVLRKNETTEMRYSISVTPR